MSNIKPMEHTYVKIKAEFADAPKRLYRTLLVREDESLVNLGCILLTAFSAEFEHCFLFSKGRTEYVPSVFMDNSIPDCVIMDDCTLKDLGEKFSFEYDTGECWDFNCKVYKKTEVRSDIRYAKILDGKGIGIWEDNAYTLRSYLAGEIDPECDEPDELNGYYFPWNLHIEKFGDFDDPLDIEEEQEYFDEFIEDNIAEYVDAMCDDIDEYDDDEFEDELDEQDIMDFLSELTFSAVVAQIGVNDTVKKTYDRLAKKHSPDEAIDLIVEVLGEQLFNLLSLNSPFGTEIYFDKLKKLK